MADKGKSLNDRVSKHGDASRAADSKNAKSPNAQQTPSKTK